MKEGRSRSKEDRASPLYTCISVINDIHGRGSGSEGIEKSYY